MEFHNVLDPVDLATTENIELKGYPVIDNRLATDCNRILVRCQKNKEENGIYKIKFGKWEKEDIIYYQRGYSSVFVLYGESQANERFALYLDINMELVIDRLEILYLKQDTDIKLLRMCHQKKIYMGQSISVLINYNIDITQIQKIPSLKPFDHIALTGQFNKIENGIYLARPHLCGLRLSRRESSGMILAEGYTLILKNNSINTNKIFFITLLEDGVVDKDELLFKEGVLEYKRATKKHGPSFEINNLILDVKNCFGKYMHSKECSEKMGCIIEELCFAETSLNNGPCDCEHKRVCLVSRQKLQEKFRQISSKYKVKDCPFYKQITNKIKTK